MMSLLADGGDCVHCGLSVLQMLVLLTSLLDDLLSDLKYCLAVFWVTVIAEGKGRDHQGCVRIDTQQTEFPQEYCSRAAGFTIGVGKWKSGKG
jgi:hypothetical protein